MISNEKIGFWVIILIGTLYFAFALKVEYSGYKLQNDFRNDSQKYDLTIDLQNSINSSIDMAILFRLNDVEKSLFIIDSLMENSDKLKLSNCQLIDYKLRFLIENKLYERAEDELVKMRNLCNTHSGVSMWSDGLIHFYRGKYEKAIELLEIAKKRDSKYSWYLGNLYEIINKPSKAIIEYELFIKGKSEYSSIAIERMENMPNRKLDKFMFLKDIPGYYFFNIKPLFYEGKY